MKLSSSLLVVAIVLLIGPFILWFNGFALSYVFNTLVVATFGWEPMNALQGAAIMAISFFIASLNLLKVQREEVEKDNFVIDVIATIIANIIASGAGMLLALMFKLYFL